MALVFSTWLLPAIAARADWKTGDAFQKQLQRGVGLAWTSGTLRKKLEDLAENVEVAIWLDRRIDPSQEPELSVREVPLSSALEFIATRLGAGVGYVGPVVYLGPPSVADKLGTVAALRQEEAAALPPAVRSRLLKRQPWQWDILATPQELLAELEQEGELQILGKEQIPHDLWPAGDLPPLTFSERLTLLLAGFDLTFEYSDNGQSVHLRPLPADPVVTRQYPLRGNPSDLTRLQQAVPKMQFKREGARLTATGRVEDHDTVARLLRGERVRSVEVTGAKTVYSMKGPGSLQAVLNTLQQQADLQITVAPEAQDRLRQRVNFEVKGATLQELLAAVFKDTDLRFELQGRQLRVSAAR